jgi:XTP/dITP diphosphohydrolase
MRRVVLASNNAGKLRELSAALARLDVQLVNQGDLGIGPADEPACTFVENAILKARHACAEAGLPALADDSGIAVNFLNGLPGVRSARFAGEGCSDSDNVAQLLEALEGVPRLSRGAQFHCVLVYMAHAQDPTPLVCVGTWSGAILNVPSGEGGFGYDPVFEPDDHPGCSAAELHSNEKNRCSHRAAAVRALLPELSRRLLI